MQVHGTNGSGKTTLLRILCGLTMPRKGSVSWCGVDISKESSSYRAQVGYLGHMDGVNLELTARENMNFITSLYSNTKTISIEQMLAHLELDKVADLPLRNLSAGQRRRVSLARVLVVNAALWILDEPFTALDERAQSLSRQLIEQHSQAGGICVFTSHQPIELGVDMFNFELKE